MKSMLKIYLEWMTVILCHQFKVMYSECMTRRHFDDEIKVGVFRMHDSHFVWPIQSLMYSECMTHSHFSDEIKVDNVFRMHSSHFEWWVQSWKFIQNSLFNVLGTSSQLFSKKLSDYGKLTEKFHLII